MPNTELLGGIYEKLLPQCPISTIRKVFPNRSLFKLSIFLSKKLFLIESMLVSEGSSPFVNDSKYSFNLLAYHFLYNFRVMLKALEKD